MKKFISSFLFCFALLEVLGQVNLVPNPSFEEYTACPQGYPDLDGKLNDWMSFNGTPDYMNNCNSFVGSNNQFGFQEPNSGEAYTGFLAYKRNQANIREHLGVQLTSSLIIGTRYYFSFYVSPAYKYASAFNIMCNKLGGLFTTQEYYYSDGNAPLYNQATIYSNEIISDTLKWSKISGSFVADSTYEYLILGNFFENQFVDTLEYPGISGPYESYYYLDDICVSTDSIYAETWTTLAIKEINKNSISIFPNPSSEQIKLTTFNLFQQIELINETGLIIISKKVDDFEIEIDVRELDKGLYYLRILSNSEIYTSKIVIN